MQSGLRLAGAVCLLLLVSACGDAQDSGGASGASCVSPYLNDQPPEGPFHGPVPTVDAGDSITIYGHWYTSTCNDTGGRDPLEPLPPVHLTLSLPGGAVDELGSFNPDGQDMGFSTVVHVPLGTPSGTATVHDDQQHPAYTFRVSDQERG
jgi:hypothetical protein